MIAKRDDRPPEQGRRFIANINRYFVQRFADDRESVKRSMLWLERFSSCLAGQTGCMEPRLMREEAGVTQSFKIGAVHAGL
jgi:hypothetical protein